MARSYRKVPSGKRWNLEIRLVRQEIMAHLKRSIPYWRRIRMQERAAFHSVLTNAENEAVFPQYRKTGRGSWWSIPRQHPLLREYIRDEYFLEISNILNGMCDIHGQWNEAFIDEYNKIKSCTSDNRQKCSFEWLNHKAVRKVIKTWAGEPLAVLRYLTASGCIEQAITCEYKKALSK